MLRFNGYRVLVGEDEKVLETDVRDSCTKNMNIINATELHS